MGTRYEDIRHSLVPWTAVRKHHRETPECAMSGGPTEKNKGSHDITHDGILMHIAMQIEDNAIRGKASQGARALIDYRAYVGVRRELGASQLL